MRPKRLEELEEKMKELEISIDFDAKDKVSKVALNERLREINKNTHKLEEYIKGFSVGYLDTMRDMQEVLKKMAKEMADMGWEMEKNKWEFATIAAANSRHITVLKKRLNVLEGKE